MCGLAGVSRAAYYRAWASSEPLREKTALRDVIQGLALANRHYGYRRIGALLRREGWCVNHKRVVRIMREDNLLCLAKPLFRPPTTDARHSWRVWPNLARHLMPMATNQLWVADLTYVRLAEAFIYLAVVLDAFSRKVVGWAMADHLRASLALDALEMALASREVVAGGLVHHSDRGIQGGFKWSTQHPDAGDCDDRSKAAFGTIWAGAIGVARPAAGGGTGGTATVLGGDRDRLVQ